jgi:hypothetical protein
MTAIAGAGDCETSISLGLLGTDFGRHHGGRENVNWRLSGSREHCKGQELSDDVTVGLEGVL